jgi:hypothetical protein
MLIFDLELQKQSGTVRRPMSPPHQRHHRRVHTTDSGLGVEIVH